MTGSPIEMYIRLELPPITVRDAVMHVMRDIGLHESKYRHLMLSVDLNIPGHGEIAVPIEATVQNRPGRWECAVHLEAAKSERFFPTFDGTVSVTPDGSKEAELWLQGQYVPPGGVVGKGLDVTLLRGVAEQSLRDFLTWLAEEVKEEVVRSERERAEQARRYHGYP